MKVNWSQNKNREIHVGNVCQLSHDLLIKIYFGRPNQIDPIFFGQKMTTLYFLDSVSAARFTLPSNSIGLNTAINKFFLIFI